MCGGIYCTKICKGGSEFAEGVSGSKLDSYRVTLGDGHEPG